MSQAVKKRVLKALARSKKYNKDGTLRHKEDIIYQKKRKIRIKPEVIVEAGQLVTKDMLQPSLFSRIINFIKNLFKGLFV